MLAREGPKLLGYRALPPPCTQLQYPASIPSLPGFLEASTALHWGTECPPNTHLLRAGEKLVSPLTRAFRPWFIPPVP